MAWLIKAKTISSGLLSQCHITNTQKDEHKQNIDRPFHIALTGNGFKRIVGGINAIIERTKIVAADCLVLLAFPDYIYFLP